MTWGNDAAPSTGSDFPGDLRCFSPKPVVVVVAVVALDPIAACDAAADEGRGRVTRYTRWLRGILHSRLVYLEVQAIASRFGAQEASFASGNLAAQECSQDRTVRCSLPMNASTLYRPVCKRRKSSCHLGCRMCPSGGSGHMPS